ncbi:MAG: aminopeptidase [Methylibium sp. NZG]|nr:MAG: aminopeptidase [Methylibium sp. NZG]
MAGVGGVLVAVLAGATLCLTAGCSTVDYYSQSIGGHLSLLRAAKPVPDWLADAQTAPALKQRLELSQRMRDFAVSELKLPDNASYRRYADLKRGSAVWNVVATPELSLTLQTHCFPVVGCVGYRGFFNQQEAEAFGAQLREQGLEVTVYGVSAYSTLGRLPTAWLADPLLNTFINWSEGELARMIFHELSHQVAYADDDTMFNESFATAVERIGGARWLAAHGSAQARQDYERIDGRRQDFRALTLKYRQRLTEVYTGPLPDADKRIAKATLMSEFRAEFETLKATRWGGFTGYDAWVARANNASFGVLAAYNELVPQFERLFASKGGDFDRFYAEVRRLAALPKDQRRAALNQE